MLEHDRRSTLDWTPSGDGGRYPVEEKAGLGDAPPAEALDAPPALDFGTAQFRGSSGKYRIRVEGGELFVELRKAAGAVDARAGRVGPASLLAFGDRRIGLLTPIVLDLDGDGIELTRRKKSKALFDMDGDGRRDDTGWVGKQDGMLVVDRNGDGAITSASEMTFLGEDEGAVTSLHGLTSLDANRDGRINATDDGFADLKIWADRNGDGVSQAAELGSLADHGIESIDLEATALNTTIKPGRNAVLTSATFTRTDGSVGTLGDAALAFRPSAPVAAAGARDAGSTGEWGAGVGAPLTESGGGSADPVDPAPTDSAEPPLSGDEPAPVEAVTGLAKGLPAPVAFSRADAGDADPDYQVRVMAASARLVQALGSFNATASAHFDSRPLAELKSDQAWLTVASMPSVDRLLTI